MAVKKITDSAMMALAAAEWGGNVRELRNIVERLVIMSPGDTIEEAAPDAASRRNEVEDILHTSRSFQEFKDRAEATFIKRQLELHNWNVSKTAEALEMERSHLYTKINKYGLAREKDGPKGAENA